MKNLINKRQIAYGSRLTAYGSRLCKAVGCMLLVVSLFGCGLTTVNPSPDTSAPTVTSVSPSDKATGVSTTAAVSAVFSKAMDDTTISTNTFTVSCATNGYKNIGTVTYNTATKTATFTPTQTITPNTTFVATVSADVKDTEGNKMGSFYTWSYTTTAESGGQSWKAVGTELTDEKACELVTDSDSNGNIYIAYVLDSNKKLGVKMYNGTSWLTLGADIYAVSPTDKISNIYLKCDKSSSANPHISFREDTSDGTPIGAYVMVYQSGSFHIYGTPFESSVATKTTNIRFDSSNNLYVGYVRGSDSYPCVKKYSGSSWTEYQYSSTTTEAVSFSLNSGGFNLAFLDNAVGKGIVVYFNNNTDTWTSLGSFSDGNIFTLTLRVIPSRPPSFPYVSFIDRANGDKLSVMKHDGSSWSSLGEKGFTDTSVTQPRMVRSTNIPTVAYRDSSGYIRIVCYNSSSDSWDYLGGIIQIASCEDTPIGSEVVTRGVSTIPFLAFSDSSSGGKVTVLEYR